MHGLHPSNVRLDVTEAGPERLRFAFQRHASLDLTARFEVQQSAAKHQMAQFVIDRKRCGTGSDFQTKDAYPRPRMADAGAGGKSTHVGVLRRGRHFE